MELYFSLRWRFSLHPTASRRCSTQTSYALLLTWISALGTLGFSFGRGLSGFRASEIIGGTIFEKVVGANLLVGKECVICVQKSHPIVMLSSSGVATKLHGLR